MRHEAGRQIVWRLAEETELTRAPLKAPKRSSMPDLSMLFRRVSLNYILNAMFRRAGAKDDRARIFIQNYIRLVDKSLEEYEFARTNFQTFVSDETNTSFGALFRAIGHMENCMYSLARAIRFAAAMAEHPEMGEHIGQLAVLSKSARTAVEKIRNSVEHMDERVRNLKVRAGDLSALWLAEEVLELEGRTIAYSDLASWLRELHALADRLADYGAH